MDDGKREIAGIKERLDRIEGQLGYLFRSLGITAGAAPAGQASATVRELAARGDRIAAIKAFREETGASLKDAKEFIESLGGPGGPGCG